MNKMREGFGGQEDAFFNDRQEVESGYGRAADPAGLDVFAGACAPKTGMSTDAKVFLSLVLGAAGFLAVEREMLLEDRDQQEMAMREKADEDVEHASVARLQEVFLDAAKHMEHSRSLSKRFSPEQVKVITKAVRTFPVEQTLRVLSQESGLSVIELAQSNELKVVRLITDNDVHEMVDSIAGSEELREQRMGDLSRAGVNLGGEGIFVNVSKVLTGDMTSEEIQSAIQDVLTHEFGHSFVGSENFYDNERLRLFYEGLTEAIANRVGSQIQGHTEAIDPVAGYVSGSTALAELVLASVESKGVVRGYLQGDPDAISMCVDAQLGAGAWETILQSGATTATEAESAYKYIAPVAKMIDLLGPNAPLVVSRANSHLSTGKMHVYQSADFSGVFLVSDLAESGIANGLLRMKGSETSILFPSNIMNDVQVSKPNNDALYVFANLNEGNSPLLFDAMPESVVDQTLKEMVSRNQKEIETNIISP